MNTSATPSLPADTCIAFIGGGNMASALIGGLIHHGLPPAQIRVLEPFEGARALLQSQHGVHADAHVDAPWAPVDLVVWAIKPQTFADAAATVVAQLAPTLHLSVMAGIRTADLAATVGQARVVRAMPNTPALVGRGMTGLYAGAAVGDADRALAETVIRTVGQALWVGHEAQLDAVTALSGSGPAYVFYFLEAMQQAGTELGLDATQARQLAVATFAGSAHLAAESPEALATLRERVTSKGGTTYAALTAMQQAGVGPAFVQAMHAACTRAKELGDAFGRA